MFDDVLHVFEVKKKSDFKISGKENDETYLCLCHGTSACMLVYDTIKGNELDVVNIGF